MSSPADSSDGIFTDPGPSPPSDESEGPAGGAGGARPSRDRGRGGRGRGRGGRGSRGRGRGGRGQTRRRVGGNIEAEDRERMERLQANRTAEVVARVQALDYPQSQQLLTQTVHRMPGLLFDIMQLQLEAPRLPIPHPSTQVPWCICTYCREMTTDLERKCCRQLPENCVSRMAHMEMYILDEGILRLARDNWNDIFAFEESEEPGADQRSFRHTAYRQFVLWQCGRLGQGNRWVIPSCCTWRIRDKFPDPLGQYTGFRARRLPE